jgi:epoxyqueuosine reductase QueG
MNEKLADTAVDSKSYLSPQGSTSFLEEPSPMPGKENPTICATCQKCADALPEHILDYDSQDKHNKHTQEIRPFHANLLSMIQSARIGCTFCIFWLETMEWPMRYRSDRPELPNILSVRESQGKTKWKKKREMKKEMKREMKLTLLWSPEQEFAFSLELSLENDHPSTNRVVDIATDEGIYFGSASASFDQL